MDGKIDLPFDLASCIAPKSYKGSVLSYQPVWADGKWDAPDGSIIPKTISTVFDVLYCTDTCTRVKIYKSIILLLLLWGSKG